MLSYVMSSQKLRNYSLHILNIEGNSILTTIPENYNEFIFLEKEKNYVISHQSDTNLYQFKVRLIKTRTIDNQIFYLFKLLSFKHLDNVRKNARKPVSFPASFIYKNTRYTRLGHIVDISENGFKLETLQPIHSKDIHISYEDENEKHYRNAKIVWSSKNGPYYYYGLKSYL